LKAYFRISKKPLCTEKEHQEIFRAGFFTWVQFSMNLSKFRIGGESKKDRRRNLKYGGTGSFGLNCVGLAPQLERVGKY